MELEVPSPKLGDLSHSDCNSDPEEKEISDEDDDDRNHKHRRHDTRSQSLERDTSDTVSAKPFRKRNKPFLNGNNHFRENDSQAGPNWKPYNPNNPANSFPGKFDRRRPPGHVLTSRSPLDINQRFRPNQAFSGDPGLARGRMRDLGLWNHDSRFVPDLASQVVQGSIPPGMFPGRGLPNVSSGPNPPWNAFGIIPGIPNGGLDAMHSMGLQGPLRPPMPAALNMGIQLQRCRDFEERGFCLRGDMCPMEHGVNRIVIEDVQGLSQFNLPVSLPSAHLLGPSSGVGPGSLSSMNSSVVPPMNSKGLHSKTSKTTFADDGLGINGSYPGSASVAGADLYDPDQPLWNNNGPETSNTLLDLHSNKIENAECLPNGDPSDSEFLGRGAGNTVGSNTTSVWGRIHNSKGKPDLKEKLDPAASSSNYLKNESRGDKVAAPTGLQNSSRQGKRIVKEDASLDPSAKSQFDAMHNSRKPTQKAMRTLFVNGVPLKNNKRENLLSHFQKFGEVIDIYIPANTERAFVQFSKKEEAEEALKAPDAVMGNRFIKLWWANRDSVADDSTVSSNLHGVSAVSILPHSSFASSKRENLQAAGPKSSAVHTPEVPASENSAKPVLTNGPKVVPPSQKKLDTLELLKEELRKKQELLEQKRNEFKRKLVKLEKQATGSKGEMEAEQVSKKSKLGIAEDATETTPRSSDYVPAMKSSQADKSKSGENAMSHSPKANATLESSSSKQHQIRPFAASGPPFLMNRYKLDNRPTAFRILPPLPAGFANVAAIKEHLLPYGEISSVELEDDVETSSSAEPLKDCSARVSFVTRRSAERAFVTGRCWQGHNLNFAWLNTNPPSSETSSRENKGSSEPDDAKPVEIVEVASSEIVEEPEDEEKISAEQEDTEDSRVLNRIPSPSPTTLSGSREPNEDDGTC